MSKEILELSPQAVFRHFYALTQIPHPSSHEEKIAAYLSAFAKEHGLFCITDSVGNVIMEKEASSDKKDAPVVIMQGHMDMVPMAASGYAFDFQNEPLKPYIDNGFIRAENTTLGADDGIAIAIILAIFEDDTLSHGPLRAIFTVEEETTMKGAAHLDRKYLEGKYLINIDSEENGFLYVNCAGSLDCNITLPLKKDDNFYDEALLITLKNLHGGHSGADIHVGYANAIRVMGSLCHRALSDKKVAFSSFTSGTLRNAIPSEATLKLHLKKGDKDRIKSALEQEFLRQKDLYKDTDSNMLLSLTEAEPSTSTYLKESLFTLIHLVTTLPSGIVRMSQRFKGIVETSNNVSMLETKDNNALLKLMPRSLNYEWLMEIKNRLEFYAKEYGASIDFLNIHEPWESPSENHLIDVLKDSYHEICHKDFVISAMHGGVECAAFAKSNRSLELISLGPTIYNPHSPDERVHIEGVKELYLTLRRTLAML